MFLEKMKKGLLTILIASAMLMSVGGSAAPPQEKAKTEVFIQNDALYSHCVEFKITAYESCDIVVVIHDSNNFVSVTTENVLATCKVLAAPPLGLESVSNENAIHNNYTELAETINSIFKDLPIDPSLCRC